MKRMFYVAMSKVKPGSASASCVDDVNDPKTRGRFARQFLREYQDRQIVHVDGDEMQRLMSK